jgi:general secretion pathway protein J
MSRPRRNIARRGFTLLELLVALAILAMISIVIYSAFSTMRKTKEGLERIEDRYREGRMAMARITRDLSSAYLSAHQPIDARLSVQKTAFVGKRDTPTDRVDFNCFCNQRRDRDAHESDQAEISYFGSENPDRSGTIDLARRSSSRPDLDPRHGGTVEVLATDIDLFQLEYLDPQTALYNETWDSTQTTGQPNRLPLNVRVTLILNSGKRSSSDGGRSRIRLVSVIAIPIQQPLSFAAL